MSGKIIYIWLALLLGLFILSSSVFVVYEGQRAIVLRLGEIQTDSQNEPIIYQPGLHFKIPFITAVRKLDTRLQSLNVDQSRILTKEQKYVMVDYFAKWKITNFPTFYTSTQGSVTEADDLLKQKINDGLREVFGNREIKEVISSERGNIMQILRERASKNAQSLGITVVDVRIQAIDLPKEVRESVYQRMRSEREQVATKHRSQGRAQSESIRANADAEVAVLVAKAHMEAQKARAAGDGKAGLIYAGAYEKDPQFYTFYRSLLAYQHVFRDKNTIMILKPDGEFFKYFTQGSKEK